ncbi:MAG: SpoIIIAH-like family protein [Coprococcus catus]|nr:SpoIIIAH-like family protein [Coprococcus catus]
MKRLFRKNQIIITSLAIMIVIAGYLNFTADQTKPVKQEAVAETAEKIREENIQAEEAAAGAEADITSFPDEDLASVSAEAESTADTETPEGEKVGEAVLTSSASAGAFSASAKLNREQVRSKNEASLLEIINNTDISEDMKADAIASMNRMTDRAEKELDAELLLEAKGFKDSVVSINDDSVDVIVGAAEITDEQKAQIEDIVTRKTERNVSDIVITTME